MKERKPTELDNATLQDAVDGIQNASNQPEVTPERFQKSVDFYRSRFIHHGYDDREPFNVTAITRYCAHLYHGTTAKGLCLIGETGRGKTFAFKIMKKLFMLRIYQANDLVEMWQRCGVKDRDDFWKELLGHRPTFDNIPDYIKDLWRDICIDDAGAEPTLNEYGTKMEVLDTIIQRRTRMFEDYGARTHLAINLTPEMIQDRYGKRFESRLHQLCHVIELRGDDRRKDGVR